MPGLTTLGIVHTLIALAAVGAGIVCFARHGRILPRVASGMAYLGLTVLTCLTSLGIFAHGGFGKPHVLAIVTLLTLMVAVLARAGGLFGRRARAVETVAYTATFLFHMIPGLTETFTRLPRQAPLFDGPEDPALQAATGVLLVLFVAGAWYQLRQLRRRYGASGQPVLPGLGERLTGVAD